MDRGHQTESPRGSAQRKASRLTLKSRVLLPMWTRTAHCSMSVNKLSQRWGGCCPLHRDEFTTSGPTSPIHLTGDILMKNLVLLVGGMLALAFFWSPLPVGAQVAVRVTGGGTGTFGADLDGDGDIDGSQFGIGVTIRANGSAQGHFLCLMAGRSDILGLPVMAVQGPVSSGDGNGDGSVTFSGVGTV